MEKTGIEISFAARQFKVIKVKAESVGMTEKEWLEFTIIRAIEKAVISDYDNEKFIEEFCTQEYKDSIKGEETSN